MEISERGHATFEDMGQVQEETCIFSRAYFTAKIILEAGTADQISQKARAPSDLPKQINGGSFILSEDDEAWHDASKRYLEQCVTGIIGETHSISSLWFIWSQRSKGPFS